MIGHVPYIKQYNNMYDFDTGLHQRYETEKDASVSMFGIVNDNNDFISVALFHVKHAQLH